MARRRGMTEAQIAEWQAKVAHYKAARRRYLETHGAQPLLRTLEETRTLFAEAFKDVPSFRLAPIGRSLESTFRAEG